MHESGRSWASFALFLLLASLLIAASGCDDDDASRYNAPADHTVSKDGARHLPGLENPDANRASCHGDDLRGDTVRVSCYECHGREW